MAVTVNDNSVRQINAALLSLEKEIGNIKTDNSTTKDKLDETETKIIQYSFSSPLKQVNNTVTVDTTGVWQGTARSAVNSENASTATNATNATNDSEGNVIKDTYLKKSELPDTFIKKSELINLVYPVGSVYLSVNDVSPQIFLGGTWEKVSSGRVLQGADSSHAGGTTIEAGLPNITGSIWWNNTWKGGGADGVFTQSTTSMGGYSGSGTDQYSKYTLDASKNGADPVYGKSTTVQPPAFVVYIWKRTA